MGKTSIIITVCAVSFGILVSIGIYVYYNKDKANVDTVTGGGPQKQCVFNSCGFGNIDPNMMHMPTSKMQNWWEPGKIIAPGLKQEVPRSTEFLPKIPSRLTAVGGGPSTDYLASFDQQATSAPALSEDDLSNFSLVNDVQDDSSVLETIDPVAVDSNSLTIEPDNEDFAAGNTQYGLMLAPDSDLFETITIQSLNDKTDYPIIYSSNNQIKDDIGSIMAMDESTVTEPKLLTTDADGTNYYDVGENGYIMNTITLQRDTLNDNSQIGSYGYLTNDIVDNAIFAF